MLESLPSVYKALSLILSSNERRERIKKRERECYKSSISVFERRN